MFNFFKKKKVADESRNEVKAEKKANQELDHIEIRTMPNKFSKVSSGGANQTKTVGLFIIIGGGIILITASAFLFWYIYNSGGDQEPAPTGSVVAPEAPANEDGEGDDSEDGDVESDIPEVFSCGFNSRSLLDSNNDNYASEDVFSCLGERLNNDCQKATSTLKTIDVGEIKFDILGKRQNKCLIKTTYSDDITDEEFSIYADTSMQCFYDIGELNNLGYEPSQLAYYVYQNSSLQNLNEESSNCLGTTVDLWQQQARRQEDEDGQNNEFNAGVDTDNDGLTDVEENTVFITDINEKDTDADGYNDQEEIFNLYNPAGSGLLADSELVSEYSNDNYNVLYPQNWRREESLGNVFFMSGVDGSIQILTQDNNENKNIKLWYADLIGEDENSISQNVEITKNNMEAIYSVDKQTAYLTSANGGNHVFILTYSPESGDSLEFLTILKMMVNSLN